MSGNFTWSIWDGSNGDVMIGSSHMIILCFWVIIFILVPSVSWIFYGIMGTQGLEFLRDFGSGCLFGFDQPMVGDEHGP